MKSVVAIYDSHLTALDAAETLKNKNYPVNKLSIIGRTKIVNRQNRIKSKRSLKKVGVNVGIVLGSTLGVLSGAGIFDIPEFGYILGAGFVKNLLAGFATGIVGGGIVSILKIIGIKKDKVDRYSEQLNNGKFLVIAQGNKEEVEKAKNILVNSGKHIEFSIN